MTATLETRARAQHEREIRQAMARLESAWISGAELDARRILAALWPAGSPENVGEAAWWRTPLGVLCASQMTDDTAHVTYQQAADMLGVTTGTVFKLVDRATELRRHRKGGVVRGSVFARIVRIESKRAKS